jgi:hypothetical protein
MDRLALPEVLKQLRRDLLEAQREGEGQSLRFLTDDVEVELQVVATEDGSVKGGVKFWVVNAEAGGGSSQASTQKLKLKLKPVDEQGNPLRVSDQDWRR